MPLFARFKNSKGIHPSSKDRLRGNGTDSLAAPTKARWQSHWNSNVVVPDEVAELIHTCTAEMKTRADALDTPFLLLPFRPDSDPSGARTFIRNFFKANAEGSSAYRGAALQQELRLTSPIVLCSIMKWCWSRIPDGVVSWSVYEGFRMGEQEAKMARNAFSTFIPISSDSKARERIIFDFFDLIAAVAAHGKMNGLGGRKLSRLAGWWAFAHYDDGKGFQGGYQSWSAAADASSHLFFAYLRSLSPDTDPSMNVIERIPRSLQAMLASTEYPPETPTLLQRTTPRVVMLVDTVSPTPFALLRRAKNFEYRDKDQVLRELAEFEDPVDALTEECKRVLFAVASTNQSTAARSRHGNATKPDESWSTFQNMGFSDIDEKSLTPTTNTHPPTSTVGQGLRQQPRSRNADADRPTTPSWAEFLNSGFVDDDASASPTLHYPPAQVLPPLASRVSTPAPNAAMLDENLAPGELAAVASVELDDAFWWVWMTSLAGEEPSDRKAVFGRCALIETSIMHGGWLIMEEQVKGAAPDPADGVYIAPKKSILSSLTKRSRLSRKRSLGKQTTSDEPIRVLSATPSKTSIAPSQSAKIKAAAAALTRRPDGNDTESVHRRGRAEDSQTTKTNSMLTIGLQSEAGPAMKWTSAYDKNTIRSQYLGDSLAGKGISRDDLGRKDSSQSVQAEGASSAAPVPVPAAQPSAPVSSTQQTSNIVADTIAAYTAAELPRSAGNSVPVASASEANTKGHAHIPSVSESSISNQPAPTTAFDKEVGVEPLPSAGVHRKPVPRNDDHPAFRQASAPVAKPAQQSPAASAAAAAAARAMQSNATTQSSPEHQRGGYKKQPPPAGLKRLFVKKADESERETSNDAPRATSNTLSTPAESGLGRRLSLLRKKPAAAKENAPVAAEPVPVPEPVVDEPTLAAHPSQFDAPSPQMSRAQPQGEPRAANGDAFARFDQGPMADMPSAVPEDTESDASPTPNQHQFESFLARHPASQAAQPSERDFARGDAESEMTMEENREASGVQDRWTTGREESLRSDPRQSEEQSVQSRPSQSARTDDGDTSGEETIESRVARIKARVAQLTGNMDSAIASSR